MTGSDNDARTSPSALGASVAIQNDLAPIEEAARRVAAYFRGVRVGCASDGSPSELALEEAEVIAGSTEHRRHEFASGRKAARRALLRAGISEAVIGCDAGGVPLFPAGYVGSISHSHGRAVAAAAYGRGYHGLGIDLEHDGTDDGLPETVLTITERHELLSALKVRESALRSPATLVFSAKESVYKAVFPTYRTRFEAVDIEVRLDPETRSLWTTSVPGGPDEGVRVRYEVRQGWIVTLAALPVRG